MMTEAMIEKDKKRESDCKDKIREIQESLVFDLKTKI